MDNHSISPGAVSPQNPNGATEISSDAHPVKAKALSLQQQESNLQQDIGQVQISLNEAIQQYAVSFLDDWIEHFGEDKVKILVQELSKRKLVTLI